MKLEEPKSDPAELETRIGPEIAPAGITAVTDVELTPVTEFMAFRPIFTESTPSSPSPVIVIMVPTGPELGENEVITGALVAEELQGVEVAIAISEGRDEVGGAAAGTK